MRTDYSCASVQQQHMLIQIVSETLKLKKKKKNSLSFERFLEIAVLFVCCWVCVAALQKSGAGCTGLTTIFIMDLAHTIML